MRRIPRFRDNFHEKDDNRQNGRKNTYERKNGTEKERDTGYTTGNEVREKGEGTKGGQTDCTGTCALAEHIDEVTLLTRPSYAKWTLQTGRPLNLICTSSQLPVKPRPAGSRTESHYLRTSNSSLSIHRSFSKSHPGDEFPDYSLSNR